jgi:acyl dehydratase
MLSSIGQELALSDWYVVDQARIDAFAEVSGDRQFLHVDPLRAAETPFGGTIAHGMLTLSLMSGMAYEALPAMEGQRASVNYGIEKVRFPDPVPAGARLRGRFTVKEAVPRGRGDLMVRFDVHVEIEGRKRPALTAEWLVLYRF